MKNIKCPKCGSTDLIIKESMFTCLCTCKKCGKEFRP